MDPSPRKGRRARATGDGRPTVRDVAVVAGVSFKTVARVINGERGVRPATAERVMAAVRQLGFRRNVIAASLKRGVSQDAVGLVIDDVSNPFFATLTRAIEDVTWARGIQLIIASSDRDPKRERAVIDSLVAQRVGGLLVVPIGRDHRYLAREMRMGTAVVFLDRPQGHLRADTLTVENFEGSRTAVRHLLAHGHERVAVLTQSLAVHTTAERLRGYQAALIEAGLAMSERARATRPRACRGCHRRSLGPRRRPCRTHGLLRVQQPDDRGHRQGHGRAGTAHGHRGLR